MMRPLTAPRIAAIAVLAVASGVRAQELEPRAYSPSPLGTNFVAVVASGTTGSILFDPTVPVTDVNADLGVFTLGHGRNFAVGGRQGLVAIAIPYAWGHVSGLVGEEARRVWRSGFADLRVKASLNLLGPKAMTVEEFRTAPRRTILGVSLAVQAPTGQFDRDEADR